MLFVLPHHQLRDEILKTVGIVCPPILSDQQIEKNMPTIYIQKTFDDYNTIFEGGRSYRSMVMSNSCIEFTDENVKSFIIQNSIPTVFPTSNPRVSIQLNPFNTNSSCYLSMNLTF